MSPIPINPSVRHLTWIRVLCAAAGVLALGALAPTIWFAVTGGLGLLALGGILGISFVAVQALPYLGQKLENTLLAARKAEARRNPIEQLQNEVMRRAERLTTFRTALVTVGGQIESIHQMIQKSQAKFAGPVIARQEIALQKLEKFYQLNIARLGQAQEALQEFKATVEQKQCEWQIALAIDDTNQALNPHAADNLIQDLLADTALRTVQDRFNNVFAELDVQLSSIDSPTRNLLEGHDLGHLGALRLPVATAAKGNV